MTASDNVDRLLGDIGLLQKYEQANTKLQHYKRQLDAALAASSDYEAVKRERDELRQLKYDVNWLAYCIVRLAMAQVGTGEGPSPSSSLSSPSSPLTKLSADVAAIRDLLRELVDKQVNAKLKRELDAVLTAEFKNIANEVILESFGPGPYDDDEAKNRIQRIMDKCRANAYAALRGPWGVNCPNCGLRHSYTFDDGMIRTLVKTSLLRVECKNKGLLMHLDYQNSSNTHGVVEFTLRGMIRTYLLAE